MKLKNIFKKGENQTIDEEKKKNIITVVIYFVLIIIALIFVKLSPSNTLAPDKQKTIPVISEKNTIISMLDPFKTYNYYQKTKIVSDLGILVVEIEKQDNNEAGIKTAFTTTNYLFTNDKYYIVNDSLVEESKDFKPFDDYDRTFTDMNNIIKLIESSNSGIDLNEEEYRIKRYKISISEAVRVYNEINDTKIAVTEDGLVTVNVNYSENKLHSLLLDLTNLYKLVDNKNYNTLIYEIQYDKLNEVSLDGIEELIN